MKYFIIQHRNTKEIMPETNGNYTRWEPFLKSNGEFPVRLFLTRESASRSLANWRKGYFKTHVEEDNEHCDGFLINSYTYRTQPYAVPVLGRKEEIFDIKEVELNFVEEKGKFKSLGFLL